MVDGRPEVLVEVAGTSDPLGSFIARGIAQILGDTPFIDAMEGYFEPAIAAERATIVLDRMNQLCGEVESRQASS